MPTIQSIQSPTEASDKSPEMTSEVSALIWEISDLILEELKWYSSRERYFNHVPTSDIIPIMLNPTFAILQKKIMSVLEDPDNVLEKLLSLLEDISNHKPYHFIEKRIHSIEWLELSHSKLDQLFAKALEHSKRYLLFTILYIESTMYEWKSSYTFDDLKNKIERAHELNIDDPELSRVTKNMSLLEKQYAISCALEIEQALSLPRTSDTKHFHFSHLQAAVKKAQNLWANTREFHDLLIRMSSLQE